MKKLNPNFLNWLFNLLGLILVAGMILLVIMAVATGCSPAKRIEKAKQTVLMDSQARHSVFLKELELFPCANDSFTVFLPGGVDSVPFPVPVLDTQKRNRIIDSLHNAYAANCDAAVSAAFDAGYNNALNTIKGQKSPQKRPDTLLTSIRDGQKEGLSIDSINSLLRIKAALKAVNEVTDKQVKDAKAETQKWIWLFIAACVVIGVSNGLWIYSRFNFPKL